MNARGEGYSREYQSCTATDHFTPMAHKLKTFAPPKAKGGRKPTHPWEKWLDGNTWELVRGKDFYSTTLTLSKFIRTVANKRGIAVSVFVVSDSKLVITPRRRVAG